MKNSANVIEFKNISVSFPGVLALEDVSFSIKKGEIHTIVGENGAGKSTLINILAGEITPSSGQVLFKGKPVLISNPHSAIKIGISTVYQELKLCPNLTILENLYLGREEVNKIGWIDWKDSIKKLKKHFDDFGFNKDIKTLVGNLLIGQQQLVEILKAVNIKSDVLILDEPTSSLTYNETEILFKNLRILKEGGATIIFISHRLDEVFRISDKVTVLRDGKHLGTYEIESVSVKNIIDLITGQELSKELSEAIKVKNNFTNVVLEVKNFSRASFFKNINLKLYESEILGIYGMQGSGRTELLETIFGLGKAEKGSELFIKGKKIIITSVGKALNAGLAMVPEDRRRAGLFVNMDVKENICVALNKNISFLGFLSERRIESIARDFVKKFSIKVTDINQLVKNLSGGNQQKVIISRWLARKPEILLVDELTRGIDVGAKAEIYKILRNLRDQGISILFVSSELAEISRECDRVIVMRKGEIRAELTDNEISEKNILFFALKEQEM